MSHYPIPHITLRQLSVFLNVADTGSVTRAARQVHLSQPACSMALQDLEKQVGIPLFDRHGNRLSLNDRGRMLLPLAQEILSRTVAVQHLFEGPTGELQGDLKLGASSTIGNYLIPLVMGDFIDEHENVHLTLEVNNTRDIIRHIREFRIDCGFIEGVCTEPDIQKINWRTDKLAIITSPKHPLASAASVSADDLKSCRWILREKGSGTRNIFENATFGVLNNIDIFMELGQSEAIKRAVIADMGISCLSVLAIESELQRGELVTIDTPYLDFSRTLTMIVHEEKYISPLLKTFLDFCSKPETC